MRALVTGANGLIGANLVRELLARRVQVRGVVREHSNLAALAGLDIELYRADVTAGTAALEKAAQGCEHVFHAALEFTYDHRRAAELHGAAVRGTENVLRAARAAGVRRVILTSSSVVFGYGLEPTARSESEHSADADRQNPYVSAKIRQDALAFHLGDSIGLEVVAACPTVCVGPHGTALGPSNGLIVAYLRDRFRLTFPGGCNVVSIADVAVGHWLVSQRGVAGEHYILGGQNLTWPALHALISDLAGAEPPRVQLNHTLSYIAATGEEIRARMSGRPPLATRDQAEMVGRYYWYDDAKARQLGYRSRPARDALAEAVSWLVMSPHVSRELRATLRLHDDVYTARRRIATAGPDCGTVTP
jgi:dihydroflavonol-4-reductase